jgi:hypothetical protein
MEWFFFVFASFAILAFIIRGIPNRIDEGIDIVEIKRKEAAERGLVLHMDAYYNGVEMYVRPGSTFEVKPYERMMEEATIPSIGEKLRKETLRV